MNKERRKKIAKIVESLRQTSLALKYELDQEETAMDNYPECFQNSPRYDAIEEAVDRLDDAVDSLDNIIDSLAMLL